MNMKEGNRSLSEDVDVILFCAAFSFLWAFLHFITFLVFSDTVLFCAVYIVSLQKYLPSIVYFFIMSSLLPP